MFPPTVRIILLLIILALSVWNAWRLEKEQKENARLRMHNDMLRDLCHRQQEQIAELSEAYSRIRNQISK